MEKTIYNTAVKLQSQEQAERLLKACEERGEKLTSLSRISASVWFRFSHVFKEFSNWELLSGFSEVTESEFLELLNNHKE